MGKSNSSIRSEIKPECGNEASDIDVPPSTLDIGSPQEIEETNLENLQVLSGLDDDKNIRTLKKEISDHSRLLATYSIAIWSIVIFVFAISTLTGRPAFSDTVFITITTGCTVNILAVLLAVTKGLFK